MVMIAFAVCAANAWAGDVMKNDPNATGILDCVKGGGSSWEEENFDCSAKYNWSHNFHSTKAICKKFVADAYYNKYKDNTGMTGDAWPDSVPELPELIDGRYMLRCVATECEDGYELARDNNGNSMGWCRKKSADKNEETGGADGESQNAGMSNNGESESGVATSATVFDNLDKFISEKFVGSSVWKNDEGNFNTARLASDSVAGVVLGTAGGIITSHIVKKNQIENGFDDLKCTIGGQTVASYGDEFRVGVK
jgi:hypothetical protein